MSLTKEQLWKLYTDKNPQFVNSDTVTLSTLGLKKLFDTTFEQGHALGFENGKAIVSGKTTPSIFDSIFKK